MSVDYIKDDPEFTNNALSRVLEQFKSSINYNKFISVISERYHSLYSKSIEIPLSFFIEDATNAQLNEIGRQLKVIREEDDDDELYRQRIKLYIRSFRNNTTREEIIYLLSALTENSDIYIYKANKRFLEISIFSDYLAKDGSGKRIASFFPITSDLLITNRGRGYTFGFQDARNESGGFGDATDIDEITGAGITGIIFQTGVNE